MPPRKKISIKDNDLKKYCQTAIEGGATHAKQIHPKSVVTAPWVRLKCQFGCPGYGKGYCCPPDTPTPDQTREILDTYQRAILLPEFQQHRFQFQWVTLESLELHLSQD